VQWRITRLAMRAARRRFRGRALASARLLIFAGDVCLIAGYLASFSALASRLGIPSTLSLYAGAAALAYLITATATVAILGAVGLVRRRLVPDDADPVRRRLLNAASGALVTAPFAILGFGAFVWRTDFRVREVDVPFRDLPPDLDGLRLLHLSDIHLSAFLTEQEFARVIDASNELRPHAALITGDMISSVGDPLDACLRQLARLRSDAGTFGCMGNHERYAHAEDYAAAAGASLGLRFLRCGRLALRFGNARVNLAGVDYQRMGERRRYLAEARGLATPGAFNILLSHNPDVFPAASAQGYNLMLAGHTHGGQVTIEILDQHINPARFFTPFVYGLYRHGGAAAYVTRGIGTIGIPARIGAAPEITLVRLRKA
jgi:predicted MPP superfamily phosphohydrolase